MGQTILKPEQAKEYAARIQESAVKFDAILNEIKTIINRLRPENGLWQGPDAKIFIGAFNNFKNSFPTIKEILSERAKTLNNAVAQYEEVDKKLEKEVPQEKNPEVIVTPPATEPSTTENREAPPEVEEPKPPKEENNGYDGELKYDEPYNVTKNRLTRSKGVVYYNGHKETWYSQEVLPGGGLTALNNNGRHVAKDGTIRDKDGYIAIAADLSLYPRGTVVMTSLGPGKVYDTGVSGQHFDIYVSTKNGW